jgi:serine/threonine-protein kinase
VSTSLGPRLTGISEGDVLAGKYRIERILGVGGMGAVVAAHHLQLDITVAIKFLLPEMQPEPEAVSRFAREARNAVRIANEHVARVLDVGTLENGAPYMVMEYLQGSDLRELLQQRGPLPVADAVDFLLQAAEAIAEAHVLGIVHRDLKPANLFCVRRTDGQPLIKVLDFGISKAPPRLDAGHMTGTSTLLGSPFYMSPEQMNTPGSVDGRADIWAMGVILFELLTGQVPFPGDSVPEVCMRVALRQPPPLRSLRPDAPDGLEAAISTCLQKDREQRYGNVAELAVALLPFGSIRAKASVEHIAATVQATGTLRTTLPAGATSPLASSQSSPRVETMSSVGRTTSGRRSKGAATWTFAAVGVLVVAAGAALVRHFAAGPAAPVPAPPASHDSTGACTPAATRCVGAISETCTDGQWVPRPVTAGLCEAQCTPGSSQGRCNGNVPQTCAAAGQWQDGKPCPSVCNDGVCSGECPPGSTQCVDSSALQTCDSNGRWEKAVPCKNPGACRDGQCAAPGGPSPAARSRPAPAGAGPAATGAPTAAPDCNPPYVLDAAGHRHYKPECP